MPPMCLAGKLSSWLWRAKVLNFFKIVKFITLASGSGVRVDILLHHKGKMYFRTIIHSYIKKGHSHFKYQIITGLRMWLYCSYRENTFSELYISEELNPFDYLFLIILIVQEFSFIYLDVYYSSSLARI